jgi:hypothetical protein
MSAARFSADVRAWLAKVEQRRTMLFLNTASHIQESIVEGDPLTTAPGQPVDTGFLKNSWQLEFEGQTARISTNVAYAPVIEENDRGAYNKQGKLPDKAKLGPGRRARRSQEGIGGHHSVRLTRLHYDRIVDAELEQVKREIP